jgi:hypothetical protein
VPGIRFPLDLSVDGSTVLGSTKGIAGSPTDTLVAVDLRSGERGVLVPAPGGDVIGAFARWAPDGSMVAYPVGAPDPAARSTLCVLVLAAAEPRCFPHVGNVLNFDWAPDGSRLVVVAGWSIGMLDVSTGSSPTSSYLGKATHRSATRHEKPVSGPSTSSSGRHGRHRGPTSRRWRDSRTPGSRTCRSSSLRMGSPWPSDDRAGSSPEPFAWSPVADVLAYTRGEPLYRITEAHVLDPASGEDRALASSKEEEDSFVLTDLAWAPSGQWLAIAGWVDRGQGYFQTTLGILDPADPSTNERFPIDTGDARASSRAGERNHPGERR